MEQDFFFKFRPFRQLNEEYQEQIISKYCYTSQNSCCLFLFSFEFSRSSSSSFEIQKGTNFKIIFPTPYPIIYNHMDTTTQQGTHHWKTYLVVNLNFSLQNFFKTDTQSFFDENSIQITGTDKQFALKVDLCS